MTSFDLGSIRAKMGLDESNFTRGMLNAQAASKIFGQNVVNFVNNPLLGMVNILSSAVRGTAAAIKETASLDQAYLRASQRLGIATRTVSGLTMAYRDQGLQAEEVEKQLGKLSIKVGEAAAGNQAAIDLFDRLGVSTTDAAGKVKGLDEIFRDVSDGLAGLNNQQQKIAIGQLLFGETFLKVARIIGEGSDAIERYIEKAERFGFVVSNPMATSADKLAGTLGDLHFLLEGLRQRTARAFSTNFIEAVGSGEAAVDRLAEKLGSFERLAALAGTATGTWLADFSEGLGIVLDKMQKTEAQIDKMREKFNAMSAEQRVNSLLNERTFLSHPISGLAFQAQLDADLAAYGVTRDDVRAAARPNLENAAERRARYQALQRQTRATE